MAMWTLDSSQNSFVGISYFRIWCTDLYSWVEIEIEIEIETSILDSFSPDFIFHVMRCCSVNKECTSFVMIFMLFSEAVSQSVVV